MSFMWNKPEQSEPQAAVRHRPASAMGLAAVVTAVYLAALGGRFYACGLRSRVTTARLIWQEPEPRETEPQHESDRIPSNPTRNYSAGRLALTAGMVIIALAYQLQVMRVGAALAR